MSKKKNKTATPSTPKPATEKKERKPRAAWATKQGERVEKLASAIARLESFFTKANPPVKFSDAFVNLNYSVADLRTELVSLGEWKAVKPGKAGIGSTITVKADALPELGKFGLDPAVYTGATVTGDDGTNWIVKCTDGITRVLKKKHTAAVA